MNTTLKDIIRFLLKFPLYYVVVNGLVALTGWNIWWCVPLGVLIVLSYDIGVSGLFRDLQRYREQTDDR